MNILSRRRFSQMLAAMGLAPAFCASAADGEMSGAAGGVADPQTLQLSRNGWVPNNEHLPVLIYRHAIAPRGDDPAALFEQVFTRNGWPPQWRNGVYTYHHYHSTAHEVLGFAAGEARLILGGENGRDITVHAGDVIVLPAGTGHRQLWASKDFLVVGAYPPEQHWDICRAAPDEAARHRMASLPFPKSDPVAGTEGALVREWRSQSEGM